jgi:hypothetical protein
MTEKHLNNIEMSMSPSKTDGAINKVASLTLNNETLTRNSSIIKSLVNADESMSPTEMNMLTVHFPLTPQQRQKISEKSYLSRDSRHSMSSNEKTYLTNKRRMSQPKEFTISTGATNSLNRIREKGYLSRQRTNDSANDALSDADCMIYYLNLFDS